MRDALFCSLLCCLGLLGPMAAHGQSTSLAATFATCTGRFSAEVEHAWLMNDRRADTLQDQRRQFADLVAATASEGEKVEMLDRQIHAKFAHAALLSQASFSDDPRRVTWARHRAEAEVRHCARFLLKS